MLAHPTGQFAVKKCRTWPDGNHKDGLDPTLKLGDLRQHEGLTLPPWHLRGKHGKPKGRFSQTGLIHLLSGSPIRNGNPTPHKNSTHNAAQ
jgi:hypothetical protein